MGTAYSQPPQVDPSYQHVISIQKADYNSCNFSSQEVGAAWRAAQPLPVPTVIESLRFNDWQLFTSAVDAEVNKFVSNTRVVGTAFFIVAFGEFTSYMLLLAGAIDAVFRGLIILPAYFFMVYYLYHIASFHQTIDSNIANVCARFQQEWVHKQISVVYETRYTNFCKPKGVRPERWIVISRVLGGHIQQNLGGQSIVMAPVGASTAYPTAPGYAAQSIPGSDSIYNSNANPANTNTYNQPVYATPKDGEPVMGRVV